MKIYTTQIHPSFLTPLHSFAIMSHPPHPYSPSTLSVRPSIPLYILFTTLCTVHPPRFRGPLACRSRLSLDRTSRTLMSSCLSHYTLICFGFPFLFVFLYYFSGFIKSHCFSLNLSHSAFLLFLKTFWPGLVLYNFLRRLIRPFSNIGVGLIGFAAVFPPGWLGMVGFFTLGSQIR